MSDDIRTIQPLTASPVAPSTGGLLRAARERAGMGVEDIASKLKLSARQITAIENEDWDALPEATFTRGFVRSYARLVGVDPESLRLNAARPLSETVLAPTPVGIGEVTRDDDGNTRRASSWLIPTLLIGLLVAGVAWFLWRGTPMPLGTTKLPVEAVKHQAQADAAAAAATATTKETSPTVLSVPPSPAAASAEAPTNAAAPAPAGGLLAATQGAAGAAPTVVSTAAGAAAPPAPSAAPGKKQIAMSFAGRSWTEIRSNGELVFTETVTNGAREVSAALPLSFVIGNASNVTVKIDGKPYDFSASIRNEVARFRID